MKEDVGCKGYLRYCDDTLGLARTKAEAWGQLNEYERLSGEAGFIVKAGAVVAPIATMVRRDGKKKKLRKRQRGRGRKKDRLSRVQLQPGKHQAEEEHQETVRPEGERNKEC